VQQGKDTAEGGHIAEGLFPLYVLHGFDYHNRG
jgi:hypothetical protein